MSALFLIVRRSLRQHLLSTTVTVLSAALGTGLVMSVFTLSQQSTRAFSGGDVGFDAVLGARGSQLQLVLNTVFHLETSPGNLPWSTYVEVRDDKRVTLAVPYAVGDNWRGWRIVGTSLDMFTAELGTPLVPRSGGRLFDERRREAVVGSLVAERGGLTLGRAAHPSHGLAHHDELDHDEEYVVTGVLEPTGTPADRVVWIPIEGIFRMGGHVLRGTGEQFVPQPGEAIPDEHREVSAVMLKLASPQAGFSLDQRYNRRGKEATLAWPIGKSIAELFDKLGWIVRVLELIAYLVVVVAALSILAALYNTMNERRREFAVLRALGARRGTVFAAIVGEAATIALLGTALGYAVHLGLLFGAAAVVRERTGVVLDVWVTHPSLVWTPLGMLALGAFAGLLPAAKAYSTDVAGTLAG